MSRYLAIYLAKRGGAGGGGVQGKCGGLATVGVEWGGSLLGSSLGRSV